MIFSCMTKAAIFQCPNNTSMLYWMIVLVKISSIHYYMFFTAFFVTQTLQVPVEEERCSESIMSTSM